MPSEHGYSFATAPQAVPPQIRSVKEVQIVSKSKLLREHERRDRRRTKLATRHDLDLTTAEGGTIADEILAQLAPEDGGHIDDELSSDVEDDPSVRFDRLPQPFRRVAHIVEDILDETQRLVDRNAFLRDTDPVFKSTQAEERLEPSEPDTVVVCEGYTIGCLCDVQRRDQFSTLYGCSDGVVRLVRHGTSKDTEIWNGASEGNPDTSAVTKIGAVSTESMDVIFAVIIGDKLSIVRLDSAGDAHVEATQDVTGEVVAALTFSRDAKYLLVSYQTNDVVDVYAVPSQFANKTDNADEKGEEEEKTDVSNIWVDGVSAPVAATRTPLFTIRRPPSASELASDYLKPADNDESVPDTKGGKAGGAKGKSAKGKGKGKDTKDKGGKGKDSKKDAKPKRGGGGGAGGKAPKVTAAAPEVEDDKAGEVDEDKPKLSSHTPLVTPLAESGKVVVAWCGLLDVQLFTLPSAEAHATIPAPEEYVPPVTTETDAGSDGKDAVAMKLVASLCPSGEVLLPSTPTVASANQSYSCVAYGLINGTGAVYDNDTSLLHRVTGLDDSKSPVTCIAFDRGGSVALGTQAGEIYFASVKRMHATSTKRALVNKTSQQAVVSLLPVASGHTVVVTADSRARLLEVRTAEASRMLAFSKTHDPETGPLLCSSNGGGSLIATVHHSDGSASLRLYASLQPHTELVLDFGDRTSQRGHLGTPLMDNNGRQDHMSRTSSPGLLGGFSALGRTPTAKSGTSMKRELTFQAPPGGTLSRHTSQDAPPTTSLYGTPKRSSASRGQSPGQPRTRAPGSAQRKTSYASSVGPVSNASGITATSIPTGGSNVERARARVRNAVQDRASRAMRVSVRRSVLKELASQQG